MSPCTEPRYERKFRIPIGLEIALSSRLLSLGFRKAFPNRSVLSMYYDTLCLDFAQENINGVACRLKIRKRWYEEEYKRKQTPLLEFKCKKGLLGYKYHHQCSDYDDGTIVKHIQQNLGIYTQRVIETSYARSYFVDDNGFRATIDTNVGARDSKNTTNRVPLNYVVLEIKYPVSKDAQYREGLHMKIMSLIPMRLNKSSKYVEGLTALGRI